MRRPEDASYYQIFCRHFPFKPGRFLRESGLDLDNERSWPRTAVYQRRSLDTTGIAIAVVAPASALVATDVEILGFWLLPHAHAQSGGLEWHAGNRGVARGIRPAGDIGLQDATSIRRQSAERKAPN